LLVIGVDPVEVALHHLASSEPVGSDGRVNVVDRGLYDLKWRNARGLPALRNEIATATAVAFAIA
jgi:hypothetical protein